MRHGLAAKFIAASFLFATFGMTLSTPASAQDQYFHGEIPNITGDNAVDYALGWRKLAIDDSFNGSATSALFAGWNIGTETLFETCETVTSGYCADPTKSLVWGESILPVCSDGIIENCLETLEVFSAGTQSSTRYLRNLNGFSFPSNLEYGTPAGGTVSIWSSEDAPHTGGSEYAVSAQINWFLNSGRLTYRDLTIRVAAVQERYRDGARVTVPYTVVSGVPGGQILKGRAANHNPGKNGCFYLQDNICGHEQEFSEGTRLKVSLRVTDKVTGWLFGRLKDPEVSISRISEGQNLLQISAEPVEVPKLHTQWNVNEIPNVIDDSRPRGIFGDGNLMAGSTDSDAFGMVAKLRSSMSDRASGQKTYWSLASVNANTGCLSDGDQLAGIVTTNAMVFSGGAPVFSGGFLNYQVAGLHYASDGVTENLGTYDLLMRSDVARCLYGYSSAPVSATVTVTGIDGAENVATTVVSERDGWLKLAAYGFTFSEKEIKVKVTQPQTKTLTNYVGSSTALTSKQKAEIRATVAKGGANPKFICTGIRLEGQPQALNTLVRKRAKLACDFAKSLNPKLSTFYQTKTTKARSFNGKVLVVSK